MDKQVKEGDMDWTNLDIILVGFFGAILGFAACAFLLTAPWRRR